MNKKTRQRLGNRIEQLESRHMMAAGDILVQLTKAGVDFGADVELSGDKLVVGAPSDASGAGKVYVYQLNGTPNPSLVRTIENPLPSATNFGRALDVNGSQLIVSGKDTAFIFDLNNPAVEKTITDPTDTLGDDFAADVAISDKYYIIADPCNSFFGGGADEVHAYNIQTNERVLLSSTDQGLGLSSVSIDGSTVAIGFSASTAVYNADTGNLVDSFEVSNSGVTTFTATALQGSQVVVGGSTANVPNFGGDGAAYLFNIGDTNPQYTWLNPEPVAVTGFGPGEEFGAAVAFDGRIAAVGEPQGESPDPGQYDSPAMAIFDTVTGNRLAVVVAPAAPLASTSPTYKFGRSIAVSGQYVAVGANSTIFVLDSGLADLNLKPLISGVPTQVSYTENSSGVRVAPNAVVTDADSTNLASGQLTAAITANSQATDVLTIRNVGNAAGEIGISGSSVKLGGVVIGTFSGGTGSSPLVVTLNSKATPSATQALLRNIVFKSTSDAPSTSSRTVKLTLSMAMAALARRRT